MATASASNLQPAGAQISAITWHSSDPTKATIQPDGDIEGIAAGTVTITATDDATGVQAHAQFTVASN
ncbi:Ig-like domain-containing protein [Vibrio harveyi]|uniref:Ig-like domain-containing protein n=1 Tax=Vibrio harveyi TaxID=669 RepID=UPI00165E2340